ncbi:MAG: hypothetical protein ACRDPA_30455 [Solirubrobacteraceae bacterium]
MAIAVAAIAMLALTTMISACGSSAQPAKTAAAAPVAESTCEQVGDALSDGPDPDADPLGYAEAQVQPLRQIHATSATLAQAITTLAGAYRSFYTANGTGPANTTLNTAIKRINSLCPDAGAAA